MRRFNGGCSRVQAEERRHPACPPSPLRSPNIVDGALDAPSVPNVAAALERLCGLVAASSLNAPHLGQRAVGVQEQVPAARPLAVLNATLAQSASAPAPEPAILDHLERGTELALSELPQSEDDGGTPRSAQLSAQPGPAASLRLSAHDTSDSRGCSGIPNGVLTSIDLSPTASAFTPAAGKLLLAGSSGAAAPSAAAPKAGARECRSDAPAKQEENISAAGNPIEGLQLKQGWAARPEPGRGNMQPALGLRAQPRNTTATPPVQHLPPAVQKRQTPPAGSQQARRPLQRQIDSAAYRPRSVAALTALRLPATQSSLTPTEAPARMLREPPCLPGRLGCYPGPPLAVPHACQQRPGWQPPAVPPCPRPTLPPPRSQPPLTAPPPLPLLTQPLYQCTRCGFQPVADEPTRRRVPGEQPVNVLRMLPSSVRENRTRKRVASAAEMPVLRLPDEMLALRMHMAAWSAPKASRTPDQHSSEQRSKQTWRGGKRGRAQRERRRECALAAQAELHGNAEDETPAPAPAASCI